MKALHIVLKRKKVIHKKEIQLNSCDDNRQLCFCLTIKTLIPLQRKKRNKIKFKKTKLKENLQLLAHFPLNSSLLNTNL